MAAAEKAEDEVQTGGIAADRLRSIIERIERLEEEKKALSSDIKDIYAESKSAGLESTPANILTLDFQRLSGGTASCRAYCPVLVL